MTETLKELVISDDWDGDCSIFPNSMMKDKDFCKSIVKSPRWNGNCDFFEKSLFYEQEFVDLVTNSENWDKKITWFSPRLTRTMDLMFGDHSEWIKSFPEVRIIVHKTDK